MAFDEWFICQIKSVQHFLVSVQQSNFKTENKPNDDFHQMNSLLKCLQTDELQSEKKNLFKRPYVRIRY